MDYSKQKIIMQMIELKQQIEVVRAIYYRTQTATIIPFKRKEK